MFIVGSYIDQPAFLVGYYNAPEGWYFPSYGVVATGGFRIDDLREISPDILDKAVAIEIMDSRDIERIFRVRGGVVNHIAMTEDFLYSCRPACGWGYRTPIEGLYLGGAGTWPGGQVTCIPGWNAAHKLIQDIQIESRDSKY